MLISIVVICFLKRKHRRLRKEQQAQALYIASSELGGESSAVDKLLFLSLSLSVSPFLLFSSLLNWLTLSQVVGGMFIPCLSLKPLLSAAKVSISAWNSQILKNSLKYFLSLRHNKPAPLQQQDLCSSSKLSGFGATRDHIYSR